MIIFILAIAAASVIPNYFTGHWVWNHPPQVARFNLDQLKGLQKNGLTVPGWKTLNQQIIEMGGHKWSVQDILPEDAAAQPSLNTPVILMLRPQTWHQDQPQVDWVDINGARRWTADSHRRLHFTVLPPALAPAEGSERSASTESIEVEARFLRGWNQQQTYAVLQWYAWSDGGSAAPNQWFWADRAFQWHHGDRLPWVGVSVLIPIKPLGDISAAQPLAESLGQTIQATLMGGALKPTS